MTTTSTDRLAGLSTSVAVKAPCKAVTTTAITQSGEQSIGGVACVDGDRYLYAIAAGSVLNGIWVVRDGDHERAKDFDGARDVVTGTMVLVKPGTAAEQFWIVKTAGAILPGTTSILIEQHTPEELAMRADLADTTDSGNGDALIGVKLDAVGAVERTQDEKNTDTVSVLDFGADPTGVTDSFAAISAAVTHVGVGELLFPAGSYKVTAPLIQPASQSWVGDGGQRATTLVKAFNGDFVEMQSLGRVENINLDCLGATYTGRGIYVSSGFSQQINRVRVYQSAGISLQFALNVGGGACVTNFEAETTNPTVVPAISWTDNTASPKFFQNIWCSGGLIDFAGGGNGCTLNGFYIRNFVTSSTSTLAHISNGRVASIADATTLQGSDITISNVAFSGVVEYENAQGYLVTNCTYGAGFTEDAATCQYNSLSDQRKAYTPVWDQASGIQPALGNGTLAGSYQRDGYACQINLRLVTGGTTTTGNNSVAYRFSIPFPGHLSIDQRGIPAVVTIGSTTYACWGVIGAGESTITFAYNGQFVRDGYPAAWAAGSSIDANVQYMVR